MFKRRFRLPSPAVVIAMVALFADNKYFLVGIIVAFGVLLYFSIQLSVVGRIVRTLTQEVAILHREVEALQEDARRDDRR